VRLAGQRREHIVGLVPILLHDGHAQGREHLLDKADLALEVDRGLAAIGLVLRVLLAPERPAGHIEGDHDVRRPFVAKYVDQHRREPVHGVGRLPGRG
jgi:hypothetical protein